MTDEAAAPPEPEIRRYQAAVSVGAMAQAWANQEHAPQGSTVVVAHEVSPLGRLAVLWPVPALSTLAFAVVLRPPLAVEQADIPWLIGALAVVEGLEAVGAAPVLAAWPESVVDAADGAIKASIRAEVQLGPGKVRNAVVSVRLDLSEGADEARREELLTTITAYMDQRSTELADGVAGPLAAYEKRCATIGHDLKISLIPRGELRGHAAAIDPLGRLELRSVTGMVEHVSVNMIRRVNMLA